MLSILELLNVTSGIFDARGALHLLTTKQAHVMSTVKDAEGKACRSLTVPHDRCYMTSNPLKIIGFSTCSVTRQDIGSALLAQS